MNWKELFDRLGLDGSRWQWKMMRLEKWWKNLFSSAEDSVPTVSQKHKFCSECGALLERDDTECVRCGKKASSWQAQATARRLSVFVPSTGPVSTWLFFVIILIGAVQILPELNDRLMDAGMYNAVFDDWKRWITYAYLHGGWMHLLFNAMALSQIGPMLEEEIGSSRFFVLYTLTGLTAVAGYNTVSGGSLVGASGSLFGLIGCGLAYNHVAGSTSQRAFYLQWAIYGILFGFIMGFMRVANSAHIGGLIGGLALGWIFGKQRRSMEAYNPYWKAGAYVCLAVVIAAIGLMVWETVQSAG